MTTNEQPSTAPLTFKGTPGPWVYGVANNYSGFYIAPRGTLPTLAAVERPAGNSNHTIIECFNFPGRTEANARLIASAPDLLEALRYTAALAQIATERRTLRGDTLLFTGRFSGMGSKSVNAILDEADAALAKALGEGQ